MDSGDTLKPVPVDLEELAEALEGDPLNSGGILNLDTGEVFPELVLEYMRPAAERQSGPAITIDH